MCSGFVLSAFVIPPKMNRNEKKRSPLTIQQYSWPRRANSRVNFNILECGGLKHLTTSKVILGVGIFKLVYTNIICQLRVSKNKCCKPWWYHQVSWVYSIVRLPRLNLWPKSIGGLRRNQIMQILTLFALFFSTSAVCPTLTLYQAIPTLQRKVSREMKRCFFFVSGFSFVATASQRDPLSKDAILFYCPLSTIVFISSFFLSWRKLQNAHHNFWWGLSD